MIKSTTWQSETICDQIVQKLHDGDVIITTTDTVLGLLAPATQQGYEKLNTIKQRNNKPYLILVQNHTKLPLFCELPNNQRIKKIIEDYWPGPLTIILPAKKNVSDYIKSSENAVAIRIPDHQGLQQVLAHFDGLFSTSANLAGEPIPETVDQLSDAIKNKVAMIVTDDNGNKKTQASTIIDCTGEEIKIIRQGSVVLPSI